MRWLTVLATSALLLTACDSEQTPTATTSAPLQADLQGATGLAAVNSVSTSNSVTADGVLANQLAILSTTFVRGKGSPKADTVTFAATSGALYIVDLNDLGSQGADGSVLLNGVTLLAPRAATETGARHVTTTVALTALNTLVVRLLGKPGSVLQVAITPLKPVTLDAVTFTSPTTIQIGGSGATFNSIITNHTAVALTGIAVQAWVQQGTARRAASGSLVFCNAAFGVLPPGTCAQVGDAVFAMNGSAGTGTLVPGSATAIIQVVQLDSGSVVLDSLSFPITLIGPTVGGFWTTQAPLPTPRGYLATDAVNGVLYALGGGGNSGGTVEAYDPAANSWTAKAFLPTPRYGLAAGVANGVLYAVGGHDVSSPASLSTVEAYDPVTNSWTAKAPLPTPRYFLAAGLVNGVLYAVGGANQNGTVGTVEAYDPVSNTWTTKAPLPTPRQGLAVGVVNGVLYAVGGVDQNGSGLSAVEAYDPAANSWTPKAPLPTSRGFLAAGVVNNILYAVGGNQNGGLGTVEAYDAVANSWTAKAPLPTPRFYLAAGVLNGLLYAVGGLDQFANIVGTVEAYHP